MHFFTLYMLYRDLMNTDKVRHQDLVAPICEYAKTYNISPSSVVKSLQDAYSY